MLSRRQLLKTGLGGAAALALATLLASPQPDGPAEDWAKPLKLRALTLRDAQLLAAIAPGVLGAGVAPPEDVVRGVDRAVAGLPPAMRAELRQLLDLLGNPWGRRWIAGVSAPWRQASVEDIEAFLRRWRGSVFPLLRSGYQALHQLLNAAWYGNPASWPALGYRQPAAVMEMLP
ncbi:twin-arginine translocation signal domain-containing protein [Chromobacterium sp. S0633]|uniref:twin-arginine translocation signal domain-containing protein n=1 Tax=Chromobacterium sp. S0633 TaxID=2957805 RepID=UPI00209F1637|nr:twin-arginine translocation signal domain-containing protein [Chromobacterium sp. S0633]MCP1288857.1 twin-arginine translocation signal domain-containing protein [Chromobacterium sp. S0633]